jgi:hypothetical protein
MTDTVPVNGPNKFGIMYSYTDVIFVLSWADHSGRAV